MQHMSQALESDSAQPEQQQDKTLQQYSEYLLQHFVQRVSWLEVVPLFNLTRSSSCSWSDIPIKAKTITVTMTMPAMMPMSR